MSSQNPPNYAAAMVGVSRFGDLNRVRELYNLALTQPYIASDPWYLNQAMALAAGAGHRHIINFLIEKGANDFGHAFATAAYRSYLDIMREMLNRGIPPEAFKAALESAITGNQVDSTRLVLKYGGGYLTENDLIDALDHAIRIRTPRGLATLIDWMDAHNPPLVFPRDVIARYLRFPRSIEMHDYLQQYYNVHYPNR